jgi:hypothetical protein
VEGDRPKKLSDGRRVALMVETEASGRKKVQRRSRGQCALGSEKKGTLQLEKEDNNNNNVTMP